jgi:TonB family protein
MTVIAGTLYSGIGAEFDEAKVQALSPGSVLIIPANVVHWGWAKDGRVQARSAARGASGIVVVRFELNRAGEVISSTVTKSSGKDVLDHEALATFAAPVRSRHFPLPSQPARTPTSRR